MRFRGRTGSGAGTRGRTGAGTRGRSGARTRDRSGAGTVSYTHLTLPTNREV